MPTTVRYACIIATITVVVILISILIVCFSSPKPPARTCTFIVKSEARSSIARDSRPRSIAVADFNNDGLPDIVVPNSNVDNIGVFIRLANSTFAEQVTYSTGNGSVPFAVSIGDFNGDERPDIVVANFDAHTIGIFLNTGNGTFLPQTSFSTGASRPRSIAVGDFNNDGQLDVVVANHGTDDVGLLFGDGTGHFARWTTFATGFDSLPYALAVADLDNDAALDLVVINYGTDNIGLLFGHSDDMFAPQVTIDLSINCRPQSLVVHDLNRDTHADLIVACSGTNMVTVGLGRGNGTFAALAKHSTGNNSAPRSVVTGDFDSDGNVDIAVNNYGTASVDVLFGDGKGRFGEQKSFYGNVGAQSYSIVTGDFNNDSRLDIAAVNYDYNFVDIILTNRIYSFLNQTKYSPLGVSSIPTSMAVADMNNDDRLDMIVANWEKANIDVFLSVGNGSFSRSIRYSMGAGSAPISVVCDDFNNDGRVDIAIADYGADTVMILLGDGKGSSFRNLTYPFEQSTGPLFVAVGDFDNDTQPDLVVILFNINSICVLHGRKDGTFGNLVSYSTDDDSRPLAAAVGDVDNDGRLDIAVANYGTSNVMIFYGAGDGTFASSQTFFFDFAAGPIWVALGDMNGDRIVDIVTANYYASSISVLIGSTNGVFTLQSSHSTGLSSLPRSLALADVDHDKQLDVIVANYQSDNIIVFLGYNPSNFSRQQMHPLTTGSNARSVVIGDMNADGQLDVVVVNEGGSDVRLLYGDGNGNFATGQSWSTRNPSGPHCVIARDVNQDNRLDIIVANINGDSINVFLGRGDGAFSTPTVYPTGTGSSPLSIATADFNSDTFLDLVVAFYGANSIGLFLGHGNGTFAEQTTYSTGSASSPRAVAVGDFNGDGRVDVLVANWLSDVLLIYFGRGDGTFSSVTILSTGSVSRPHYVVVADLNHDQQLDIAVINEYSGTVGVFLGHENGTFSSQTSFPINAISAPRSAAVGDLNGDGDVDIVVTTYFRHTVVVFLGDGTGSFSLIGRYSTGSVSFPGECVVADWNNDARLDIIVANCGTNTVLVLLGLGDGTFIEGYSHSTGLNACPVSLVATHLDNDTLLDVVVANYQSNTIAILLGFTRMGGVREATYATGSSSHPQALALVHLDNDAQLDTMLVNYGWSNVGLLTGHTNGTFPTQITTSTGNLSLPTSIAVGDLNDDGKMDVVIANSAADSIAVLYGHGNDSFARLQAYPTGVSSSPRAVAIADVNEDGKLDMIVANTGSRSIFSFVKYDTGTMREQMTYPMGGVSAPRSVSAADVNNDGRTDLIVANQGTDEIRIFLGSNNGTFIHANTLTTAARSLPMKTLVVDLNNNSHSDIVVCLLWGGAIGVFLGLGNGTFSNLTTYSTGTNSGPGGLAVIDVNNDSRLDLIVVLENTHQIGILYGNGDGTFESVIPFSTGENSNPTDVTAARFRVDSDRVSIVVANFATSVVLIVERADNGTFFTAATYSTGIASRPMIVVAADVNHDGKMDMLVSNQGADCVSLFFGHGDGTFSKLITLPTGNGSAPFGLAVGDFNNDKQLDIVVSNFGHSTIGILIGHVNGTFFSKRAYSIGDSSQPMYLTVGYFNDDDRLDVAVVNHGAGSVSVFFGYAEEDFLGAAPYDLGSSAQPVAIATHDLNNDTILDVVIAGNSTDSVTVVFGSGFGTFTGHTSYSTGRGSQPCSVAVAYLNNDAFPDIVVVNAGSDTLGVFLSTGVGTFASQMTYSAGSRSQPRSVVVLDFDNDTRLDIAVANYGTNNIGVYFGHGNGSFASQIVFKTGYRSHPFGLAVGDVNNDDLTDIVASNDGYGNITIVMKTC